MTPLHRQPRCQPPPLPDTGWWHGMRVDLIWSGAVLRLSIQGIHSGGRRKGHVFFHGNSDRWSEAAARNIFFGSVQDKSREGKRRECHNREARSFVADAHPKPAAVVFLKFQRGLAEINAALIRVCASLIEQIAHFQKRRHRQPQPLQLRAGQFHI